MKNYGFDTQKGKLIRILIAKGADKWITPGDIEKYTSIFNNIYIGYEARSRLSNLKTDGILDVEFFENPAINPKTGKHCYHKARYRIKPEYITYYKQLYKIG